MTSVTENKLPQDDLDILSSAINEMLADPDSSLSQAIRRNGSVMCLTPFLQEYMARKNEEISGTSSYDLP